MWHHSLQTVRAVERATPGEQYSKEVGDPDEELRYPRQANSSSQRSPSSFANATVLVG